MLRKYGPYAALAAVAVVGLGAYAASSDKLPVTSLAVEVAYADLMQRVMEDS